MYDLCLDDGVVCGAWFGVCCLCCDWVGIVFGECVCFGVVLFMWWLCWCYVVAMPAHLRCIQ